MTSLLYPLGCCSFLGATPIVPPMKDGGKVDRPLLISALPCSGANAEEHLSSASVPGYKGGGDGELETGASYLEGY